MPEPQNPKLSVLIAVLLLATAGALFGYVLWPFDLIPDFIPVVGWIDDGIALLTAIGLSTAAVVRLLGLTRLLTSSPREAIDYEPLSDDEIAAL